MQTTGIINGKQAEVIEDAVQKLGWIIKKANSIENLCELDFSDLLFIARTANDARRLLESEMTEVLKKSESL